MSKALKAAGVLFTNGKQFLLLKRSNTVSWSGSWGMPGGRAEYGENPLETASRECKEEIGIDLSKIINANCIGIRKCSSGYFVFIYYINELFTPELNDEHDDWKWATESELKQLPLHHRLYTDLDNCLNIIKDYLKLLSSK